MAFRLHYTNDTYEDFTGEVSYSVNGELLSIADRTNRRILTLSPAGWSHIEEKMPDDYGSVQVY